MGPVTQEDPIGIAGGLNLYGYAGGDPINFTDPFGLCGKQGEGPCPVWFAGLGVNVVPGAGGGGSVGVMWDRSQGLAGIGVYATTSVEGGLDISTFVEGGASSNRADFEGVDIESCGGGGPMNVCIGESADGRTIKGSLDCGIRGFRTHL